MFVLAFFKDFSIWFSETFQLHFISKQYIYVCVCVCVCVRVHVWMIFFVTFSYISSLTILKLEKIFFFTEIFSSGDDLMSKLDENNYKKFSLSLSLSLFLSLFIYIDIYI